MSTEMEWREVQTDSMVEETKIVFDIIGDEFVGTFLGTRTQEDEEGKPYTQLRFQVEDEFFFTNANYSLRQAFKGIRAGSLVKIVYEADVDTGRASPMKSMKVSVARTKAAAAKRSENS